MTIAFSPPSSTMMMAWPVASSASRWTPRTSTPAAQSVSATQSSAAPMAPTWRTAAPARAAAMDWFAPFPPRPRDSVRAAIVSPGWASVGRRYT